MIRFSERRSAPRLVQTGVSAFYWDGSVPVAHQVRDISQSGAYLYTEERWFVGTALRLSLNLDILSITIWARVVRHGPDGVAVEFIPAKREGRKELDRFINAVMTGKN